MCPLSSDPAPLAKHRCAWGDSGCQRLSWISRTYPLESNQIPIDLAHWRCAFLTSRLASISFPIAAAFSPALFWGTDPHKGWHQPPLLGAGGAGDAETLKRIAANLRGKGLGALTGARVKQAATQRVFGFEIMPAPFVVAHLQVGLTMQALDAPLSEDGNERAGVFLTNALTGWEPRPRKPIPFPELEEERNRADQVKREEPVLVILGNPPYNGLAGMAVEEERELSETYRTTKEVRRPEGQGLNDLYVRFFRMAERRIAEKTGRGIVCFISNYSWLDGLSFTGMRERYLESFDAIRIDCLNGDKYKTGKTTPEGAPDPSIFSTPNDPVGIQVGTAISTLVRKANHTPVETVGFRHLWGHAKLSQLSESAEAEPATLYDAIKPVLPLGLPFATVAVNRRTGKTFPANAPRRAGKTFPTNTPRRTGKPRRTKMTPPPKTLRTTANREKSKRPKKPGRPRNLGKPREQGKKRPTKVTPSTSENSR